MDDIPKIEGELYLALVTSKKAHAKIVNVDVSDALSLNGVVDWVDHNSINEERNKFATAIIKDELVFAVDEVHCVGMIIGAIVAKDQETAQRAARLVKVSEISFGLELLMMPLILDRVSRFTSNSYHGGGNCCRILSHMARKQD